MWNSNTFRGVMIPGSDLESDIQTFGDPDLDPVKSGIAATMQLPLALF